MRARYCANGASVSATRFPSVADCSLAECSGCRSGRSAKTSPTRLERMPIAVATKARARREGGSLVVDDRRRRALRAGRLDRALLAKLDHPTPGQRVSVRVAKDDDEPCTAALRPTGQIRADRADAFAETC